MTTTLTARAGRRVSLEMHWFRRLLVLTACVGCAAPAKVPSSEAAPFVVLPGLFDQQKPSDLGLAAASDTETILIHGLSEGGDHYVNGVVLTWFKGFLYAQWQSSTVDEDSADTWVAYSRSSDGKHWSTPLALARGENGPRTTGGWWVSGDRLVAYINVWPSGLSPKGGNTEYVTSENGLDWSAPKPVLMADGSPLTGVLEQDPRALPNGRIVGAAHFQPGLRVAPCYTDDASGTAGWQRAPFPNLAHPGDTTRELEPSWYLRADSAVVMLFRDQNSSFRKLASISRDRGATWSAPIVSDMPDARTKQSAGNLPDGSAYLVGNPVNEKRRSPLVVTLSRDGRSFDKAFLLRAGSEVPPRRYEGKAKTIGYNYPKSIVAGAYLYVSYATNKELVELTRVPLTSLRY
ncbi:MAG: exo-alpha-sialidase [Polyangiaceae bacterium]